MAPAGRPAPAERIRPGRASPPCAGACRRARREPASGAQHAAGHHLKPVDQRRVAFFRGGDDGVFQRAVAAGGAEAARLADGGDQRLDQCAGLIGIGEQHFDHLIDRHRVMLGVPAVKIGHHGDGGVAKLGLAGQFGLGHIGHADHVAVPAAVEPALGQGAELRPLHRQVGAAAHMRHAQAGQGRLQVAAQARAHRVGHGHMGHAAGAEKAFLPRKGAVDELVGDDEGAGRQVGPQAAHGAERQHIGGAQCFECRDVGVHYGEHQAIRGVSLDFGLREITALIGPSGCGKSTFLRCLNRMNDLIPNTRVDGQVLYHGQDLYSEEIDPVQVRKRIGMVFQKPNPFPKSVYDNVAFGPRVVGMEGDMDEIVERALIRCALWEEVKDRLDANAFGMSGGQQQRLCIARALATDPDVLLMDEPCSALDPISTGRIEDLMTELKERISIVIVTHNMQQAARVSDKTAFFTVEMADGEKHRTGVVVEYADTTTIFTKPRDERTEDYVTGKFG